MTLRSRFAPSPTGYLHIGGARTALFSWLLARRHNGQFILRIEDTDRKRSTDASVQAILDGMQWLGLDYDEGPIYQTARFDRYKEVVNQLLREDKAYYCYSTPEEVDEMRETARARGEKPRYNGKYRDFTGTPPAGIKPVIRFKNPLQGTVKWLDEVRGDVEIANAELDDLVIARGDGTPTYNLTVVVDDLDMGMTHVLRGDDHINNTPRQINIIEALGGTPPRYGHAPMILGSDGARLSKRHGAVSVMQYRDEGFLPQALLNYLVRLGWSHGDQELFSIEDMVEQFDTSGINRAPSTFNPEKLTWLNQQYIKSLPIEALVSELNWHLQHQGLAINDKTKLHAVVDAHREKANLLTELVPLLSPYFEEFDEYDPKAANKQLTAAAAPVFETLLANFSAITDWSAEAAHAAIQQCAQTLDLKLGKIGPPLRVALLGKPAGPDLPLVLQLLGQKTVLLRIERAAQHIKTAT